MLSFQKKFEEFLQSTELRAQEIAKRIDVDRQTIGNYRSGKSTPKVNVLQALKAEFGLSLDWLISGAGETRSCTILIHR